MLGTVSWHKSKWHLKSALVYCGMGCSNKNRYLVFKKKAIFFLILSKKKCIWVQIKLFEDKNQFFPLNIHLKHVKLRKNDKPSTLHSFFDPF